MRDFTKDTYPNPALVPPEIEGQAGKGWFIDIPPTTCGVAAWLLYVPQSHPFWWNYCLAVYHLRPVPDKPPPIIYLEGATHELSLAAVSPDWVADWTKPVQPASVPYLHPLNFAVQLICGSDLVAAEIVRKTAVDVVEGRLDPDTDYLRHWIERFGDNMIKK